MGGWGWGVSVLVFGVFLAAAFPLSHPTILRGHHHLAILQGAREGIIGVHVSYFSVEGCLVLLAWVSFLYFSRLIFFISFFFQPYIR